MPTPRERLNELRALENDSSSPRQRLEELRQLDQQATVPDAPQSEPLAETFLPAPVAEGAAALNRGVVGIPDFFIDAANTLINAANENPALASAGTALLEPLLGKTERIPNVPRVEDSIKSVVPQFGQKNFMEPGLARTVVQEAGEIIPGLATAVTQAPKTAAAITQGLADDAATKAAVTAGRLRTGDKRAVGSQINEVGKVVADPISKGAVTQGFSDGVVATINASTAKTKAQMRQMLKLTEDGLHNSRTAIKNRPADVIGNVIGGRVSRLVQRNRRAGEQLNVAAKKLRGKSVDLTRANSAFIDDLTEMGVTVSDDLTVSLKGSSLEDLPGAQNTIELMLRRAEAAGSDAFKSHRLKRFIDNRVDFDKSDGSLAGDLERAIKGLRHNIDQALDGKFKGYKQVNDVFSETRGAVDAFTDVAGRKLDLSSPNAAKQIGTLSRRLMSNAQSRAQLMDALDLVEGVAKKYGDEAGDDLIALVQFGDELDRVFKPAATTSLRAEVAKGAQDAVRDGATRTLVDKFSDGAVKRLTDTSDEAKLKSLRALLSN